MLLRPAPTRTIRCTSRVAGTGPWRSPLYKPAATQHKAPEIPEQPPAQALLSGTADGGPGSRRDGDAGFWGGDTAPCKVIHAHMNVKAAEGL